MRSTRGAKLYGRLSSVMRTKERHAEDCAASQKTRRSSDVRKVRPRYTASRCMPPGPCSAEMITAGAPKECTMRRKV